MKKLLAIVLTLVLAVCGMALVACGPDGNGGETPPPAPQCKLELELVRQGNDSHYEVAGIGEETSKDIVIPDTYNGSPVTVIKAEAFNGEDLDSVIIGKNVTTIESNAFGYYSGTTLTIPASVITIEAGAFANATFDTLVFEKTDNWGYQWGPITPVAIPDLTNPATNATLFTTNFESGWTNNSGTLPTGYLGLVISQR